MTAVQPPPVTPSAPREHPPTVRFDDMSRRTTTTFTQFLGEIRARTVPEVRAALEAAERAALEGHWVGGFITYDAAPAFDEAFVVAARHDAAPLVWFGVFAQCEVRDYAPPARLADATWRWTLEVSPEHYEGRVAFLQDCIRRGEVYQVNFTSRWRSADGVDPAALYDRLLHLQQPAYAAMITLEDLTVMSASPELLFDWRDSTLRSRPMKGTHVRGRFAREDAAFAEALATSPKEQAENIMIVDLMRNDLAKVAELGTVEVVSLLDVERYPQVLQMVSEVRCRTPHDCGFYDVVAALFPGGSVTGAPEASAMSLIARTESSARGVYCGAVGSLSRDERGLHARFNVAIRTALARGTTCEFGAGGGIVSGSDPRSEYREMVLKARQLEPGAGDFALLETFRHDPLADADHRDRHLRRLVDSARRLGFARPSGLDALVEERLGAHPRAARVRVLLSRAGELRVEIHDLTLGEEPVTLAIDDEAVDSHDPMLFLKTTHREPYRRRQRRFPDVDDVVMVNERGECTETTVANLMVRLDGGWFTPALSSGCLPGIGRELVLEAGVARERVISVEELRRAEGIAVVSSLRGWRRARLGAGLRDVGG